MLIAEVVQKAWGGEEMGQHSMAAARGKLIQCRRALAVWSKQRIGGANNKLKWSTKRLERLQQQEHPGDLARIKQLQLEINTLLEMEDIKWRQRAKRNWYKEGDIRRVIVTPSFFMHGPTNGEGEIL